MKLIKWDGYPYRFNSFTKPILDIIKKIIFLICMGASIASISCI